MSLQKGKRDIVRLRTFSGDVDTVQQEKGLDAKTVSEALPQEQLVEDGGVLRKVKKKSLDIQDNSEQAKALDAEGISFDEEVAKQVAEQAYEENKSVQDGVGEVDQTVDGTTGETITPSQVSAPPSVSESAPSTTPSPEPVPQSVPEPVIETKSTDGKSADAFLAMHSDTNAASAPAPAGEATSAPEPTPTITINQAETVDQIDAPSEAVTPGAGEVHDITEEDVSGGAIVSDKKRDRFKLFPAIGEAVTDWFVDTKDQIEEAQREKHTISKTADRAETIKAAAQAKTLAPEEDFGEVATHLKNTEKTAVPDAPVMVKPKTEVAAGWTHTIPEDGEEEPTSDAASTESAVDIAPDSATEAAPTPLETQGAAVVAATETEPAVHIIKDAKISPEDLGELVAPATPETAPAVTEAVAAPEVSVPEPIPAAAVPEPTPAAPAPTPTGRSLPSLPSLGSLGSSSEREWLPSPMLALAVVGLAILAGVGTSLFFFWQPSTSNTVPISSTQPLFTAQIQSDISFDGSHSEIMQTMLSGINSSPDALHLYFTRDAGQSIVRPPEVMNFLAPQAPGSFIRSVTNVSFGALENRPFIVLKVNNFDNAFAGMLAWEQTMSADLAPLFGPVVTESFDSQSRTASQARAAFFKDIIASNLSGRLLANKRAEDRIIYTFIDKQTIVITTDRLQLSNILPLIR